MINTNLYIEDMYHAYDSRGKIFKFHLGKIGCTLILEWRNVWEMRRSREKKEDVL